MDIKDIKVEEYLKRVLDSKVKKVNSLQDHVTVMYNKVIETETFLKFFKFKKYETTYETLEDWKVVTLDAKLEGRSIGKLKVAFVYHEPTNTTYWKYNDLSNTIYSSYV